MKTAVVGSINMDMTVTAERIPLKGETLKGEDIRYIPGGKGNCLKGVSSAAQPAKKSWEQMWRCSAVWAVMRREEAS